MNVISHHYEKLKFGLLIVLVASLPFYLQIANVLIALGALLTVVKAISEKSFNIRAFDKLSLVLLCYFALEVIALGYTSKENLSTGLFTLDKHQAFVLLPLFFYDFTIRSLKQRESLFYVFIASCFITTVICISVQMHESLTLYDKFFHEWLFSHARLAEPIGMQAVYLTLYLSFAVLIITHHLREKGDQLTTGQRVAWVTLLLYFLLVIIALGARTLTVALMLLIVLAIFIYAIQKKSSRVWVLAICTPLIFFLLIMLNPVVKTRFMDMLQSSYEKSNYGTFFARIHIWQPGIEAIRENLIAGVGTGDHQTVLDEKFAKYNYTEGIRLQLNMHSQYLQVLLNYGLIGLSIFLSILYIQMRAGLRFPDWLYFSFLVLFALGCITESMLTINKGTIFFLVFSFIFFKYERSR